MGSAAVRILLVEDSPSDAEVLQETLHHSGAGQFEFTCVERLADALERLRADPFDVLLLDLSLPDSTGPDTFRRARRAAPRLPIVVLTGLNDEALGLQAVREGIQDYLAKGQTDGRQIIRAIRYAIERSQAEEELRELNASLERHAGELEAANKALRDSRRAALNLMQDAVAARQQAEQANAALRQSEERYRSLFNTLIEGFCIIEVLFDADNRPIDYRFLEINPAFEAQTGLRAIQGRTIRELVPENEPRWYEVYGKVALTGEPVHLVNETKALHRWFDVTAYRVGGPDSRRVAILFNDITERKRAEEETFKLAQRLGALMQAVPVGVSFSDDATCQRITGNPAALTQFAVTGTENLSASAPDASAPGRRVRFFRDGQPITDAELPLQRAVAENRVIPSMELEVELPSGRRWFAEASGAPVRDAHGNVAAGLAVTVDVTERKRAEMALQTTLQRFYHVLSSMYSAVLLVTEAGRVEFANQAFCDIYGLTDAPTAQVGMESRAMMEKIKPAYLHPDEALARIREILDRGQPVMGEELALRDGKTYLRDFVPVIVQGKSYGRLWIHVDITERKRAEAALRESEERYKAIVETQSEFVARYLPGGMVTFVNGALCRFFGCEPEDLLNKSFYRFLHEDDRGEVVRRIESLHKGDPSFVAEARVVLPDGRVTVQNWTHRVMFDAAGNQIAYQCNGRDVTERKRAEEAVERARLDLERQVNARTFQIREFNAQLLAEVATRERKEAELTEAEFRFRTVAEFTYDWEYWETPEHTLRFCSPSCERITGYTSDELVADPGLMQRMVYPEDVGVWRDHRHDAPTAPRKGIILFRIRQKGGGIRWLEHACQPVVAEDGAFLGIRASNRDVTERREAEMETQRLRYELTHVTRATTLGQLTASLAHELNQPLGAILCNAEAAQSLLGADPANLEEVRAALGDIIEDDQRAGQVIRRLRAMFKKEAGERQPLDVNELVRDTLALLRSELILKNVSAQLELAPSPPPVVGDRVELQQVLLNLVLNAADAMASRNAGRHEVRIQTSVDGPHAVRVSVADRGSGLPAELLADTFAPFFTTKPHGMGMGLKISQSIVEAHSGRLWAVNNPDQGATFHFTLPVAKAGSA